MIRDRLYALHQGQDELQNRIDGLAGLVLPTDQILVGKILSLGSLPTTVNAYYPVGIVSILGQEVEGSAGVITDRGLTPIMVFMIGSSPPSAGDFVLCRFVRDRWVGEHMKKHSTGVLVPSCYCPSIPSQLTLTVTNPQTVYYMLQSAVLSYVPTPASLHNLALGTNTFLSTKQYVDQIFTDPFWYHFSCVGGYFVLDRVYATSSYGSPYRDITRYRWPAGTLGNTCSPFRMIGGQIYPGGNTTCIATVTG